MAYSDKIVSGPERTKARETATMERYFPCFFFALVVLDFGSLDGLSFGQFQSDPSTLAFL